ncbi:MAG TPA: PD-(D/E)XK nuclease family protein [Verrucomicrobiae bacterium]|jgi:ATP-dependent helicase/nuclease subunit B|nr:PD-(D/E)XK nuclease family protein [Verrucomicrobiae bacterium]
MRARFLLGRAGAGKTFSCLAEARRLLLAEPEGAPLIFIAPKQATFQLERQLLSDPALGGYTRLRILSFERLAQFVLEQQRQPLDALLSEQGRIMALRAILARRKDLQIFRESGLARFAQDLSQELRQWQRRQYTPAGLARLAARTELNPALRRKLHDLGLLLEDYLAWLEQHRVHDPECLLDLATRALEKTEPGAFPVAALWLDGFAEMSAQEVALLAAVAPHGQDVTLAFCLDPVAAKANTSWLSLWTGIDQTRQECWLRLRKIPGAVVTEETLVDADIMGRFAHTPDLRHLEQHWAAPVPFAGSAAMRLAVCSDPEMEAVFAAQEILRFVRSGGRYRDVAVLVRKMEGYGEHLSRVFARYGIPYFLDRRESASHHPLAELTRDTLRATAFDWAHNDWFGALKSGLVSADANAVDRLENEALRRGWKGEVWFKPLPGDDETVAAAERLRQQWMPPFARFRAAVQEGGLFPPTGETIAEALRQLWRDLRVEARVEEWGASESVHATVWEQMNILLDDLALAFGAETLPLRDWMQIIEAGLTGLTVGVIPPALDQVLIGAIDRSRNPELKLVLVLGMNETVFPAPPRLASLLSESDRDELRMERINTGPTRLQWLGREQFLAYIACTRSHERLIVTCAEHDAADSPLNPSPFFARLQKLFPEITVEKFAGADWREAEHAAELADHLVEASQSGALPINLDAVLARPGFARLREQMESMAGREPETLADLTGQLYGPALKTSVSRLEDYAACSFKFFTRSGLRAEERQIFELDVRERGSFQHAALAAFHDQLRAENKQWRDISPDEGRERVRQIVEDLAGRFRDGLLESHPQARFAARTVAESLGEFVAASIAWMKQYQFDPCAVELAFGGEDRPLPAWEIDLGDGRRLIFRGIIDRIDLARLPDSEEALAVVLDYKSSERKLDATFMAHGLRLQLAAYLAALRQLKDSRALFGVSRLIPAGMFYVSLRGVISRGQNRQEALTNRAASRLLSFQHAGRFDFSHVRKLDASGASVGTQFNYRIRNDGQPHANNADAMRGENFLELLDDVEAQLRRMGREIYAGAIRANPFQKGDEHACDKCASQAICRFDAWSEPYRMLKAAARNKAD